MLVVGVTPAARTVAHGLLNAFHCRLVKVTRVIAAFLTGLVEPTCMGSGLRS